MPDARILCEITDALRVLKDRSAAAARISAAWSTRARPLTGLGQGGERGESGGVG